MPDGIFEFDEVMVDLPKKLTSRAGEQVHLTPIEFRLFSVLTINSDRYSDYLRRNAFNTTINELTDMPMAAINGEINPVAANGRATRL